MEPRRPRLVGINHVALEVRDLDEALGFLDRVFGFELRGQVPGMAFVDMGDQFLALSEGRSGGPDEGRHFGLVVDSLAAAREALEREGAEILPGRGLDFRDPSGNLIQLVEYGAIQFTKDAGVLEGMGAGDLEKTPRAMRELRDKGLA
ncbi:MAG: VOC family protein [Actinomycetota bacterium]|nr:VOC family protein [Actinomycetota bacterium]MDQ3647070.1 VOC family protein [Actinomycetota bacterium]